MGNFNKVFLMGNMTRDPELRYTPSGTPVCDFGLAINRNYTAQGEKREETCFVDVTFWSRQAEVISEYLGKGDPIFIEGRLKLDQWETPEGRRSKLKVVGNGFQFVGRSSGGGGGGEGQVRSQGGSRGGGGGAQQGSRSQGGGAPQEGAGPAAGRSQSQGQQGGGDSEQGAQEPQDSGYDVSDDEIPF